MIFLCLQVSPAPAAPGAETRMLQVRLTASQSETVCACRRGLTYVIYVFYVFAYACSLLYVCTFVFRDVPVCVRI